MEKKQKPHIFWPEPDGRTLSALDQLKHSEEMAPVMDFLKHTEEHLKDALVTCHEDVFQRLQGAASFVRDLNSLISNARGYTQPPRRGV